MAAGNNGAKTDVVVKLVLVFFISLLSFSIGTFVGKKFSDNQHKIAQLEPKSNPGELEREVASVHPEASEVKPKDALNDDEIKKLAEEFVSDDEGKKAAAPAHSEAAAHGEATPAHGETAHHEEAAAPAAHGETHGAPVVVPTHDSHDKKEVAAPTHAANTKHGSEEHATPSKASEASKRVVAGHSPEPEHKSEETKGNRIPQSLPKELSSSAIGKFTVQVASYPTEDEAQKVAGDLKEKGFSSFYVPAKIKDKKTNSEKTWFRVSVGLFNTQKEAEIYKTDLLARAKISSAIIQKITE